MFRERGLVGESSNCRVGLVPAGCELTPIYFPHSDKLIGREKLRLETSLYR